MMRRLAAFVFAVAASATLPALADAYTFAVGEAIPLFDSSDNSTLSYVTLTDAQMDGTIYEIANTQYNDATIVVNLRNSTLGDYLLSFLGTHKDNSTTYTVTVQGTGDAVSYTRTMTGPQDQTSGGWSIDSYGIEHLLLLDALPAGDFTLTLTANRNGSWAGHYGNFTIKNLSGNALDMAESSGSAFAVKDQSYVKVLKNAGNLTLGEYSVGSTRNNDSVQFSLFSANATGSAKYSFSFDVATYDNYPTVTWRLVGPGVDETFSDRMPPTGNDWDTYTNCTYNLGVLPNGAYTLTMSINSNGRHWAGNYKNFTFTTSGNIDVTAENGLTLDADADWSAAIVSIENGAIINLNGHNLTIGSGIDTLAGTAVFINSVDETLSTLTIANPDNGNLYFGGNLRYVATGTATNFRQYNSGNNLQNTHTGGTVLSNLTAQINFYCPANFGTGNLVFAGNASAFMPSNERQDFTSSGGVEVHGSGNSLSVEGIGGAESWDSATIKFNGELSGDGELTVSNGWQPQIHFAGPSTNFTGTLIVRYHYTQDYSWSRGIFFERAFTEADGSASLENASVLMKNKETDARNRINIAGNTSTLVTFPIGALTTEGTDADTYTNTVIYTYKDGVNLEVGARGEDGTFAGNVIQKENSNYQTSLVKVGAGTWTLTGTNHVYGGMTTVKGGRLNIDSAEFTAGTAIIVTNAVLGGTGTIKVPITVKEDGTLTGSFTATSTVTFEAGAFVEVTADAAATPTFSGAIDASTLTVKLTGELDTDDEYTILTAGSGSSGRATVVVDNPPTKGSWRTKWVASGDTKVLKGYFAKPGLTIVFR